MKTRQLTLLVFVFAMSLGVATMAFAEGYPWRDHSRPFDFRFGNHFDMHQQSKLLGNGELQGFQYIEFTGAFTPTGQPIAMHGQATVGWIMHGIPGEARLVALGMHHPTWLVEPPGIS